MRIIKLQTAASEIVVVNLDFMSSIKVDGKKLVLTMSNGDMYHICSQESKNDLLNNLGIFI
jgi:hypothetical protein